MKRIVFLSLVLLLVGLQSCSLIDKGYRPVDIIMTPVPGEYTAPISVTIGARDDIAVYYTTDGTDPHTSSTVTQGRLVTVSQSLTIWAFGMINDSIATIDYKGLYTVK